ncbi:MAG TPA: phage holin family protein [Clostridiales bacterium]|nr:phage holin family protein [Clostridiales bacterium]HOL91763.1 phage holin family protein [Clostridiales bacterium]
MAENVERSQRFSIGQLLVRWLVGAIVLAVTAFLTPGFTISGIWPLIIAAAVIAILDYIVEMILGVDATPFGRGLTGFIVSAVIIYVVKFFVAGYNVTVLGAILGAVVYGIINLLIPGRTM